jgi:ankyrin repeat protein
LILLFTEYPLANGIHTLLSHANVAKQSGDTALHIAVKSKDKDMYELLLKCGADPNKVDNVSAHDTILTQVVHSLKKMKYPRFTPETPPFSYVLTALDFVVMLLLF